MVEARCFLSDLVLSTLTSLRAGTSHNQLALSMAGCSLRRGDVSRDNTISGKPVMRHMYVLLIFLSLR